MPELSEKQLDMLRHMLGINDPWMREPEPTRDYYAANPEDEHLIELASLGMVRKYSERGEYFWYCSTPAGRAAAIKSHRSIRYSKSKRVYGKFLDISDCFADLTFKQFLTDPQFAETRRSA